MFKIEEDYETGSRCFKVGNKILFRWYRTKLLIKKVNQLNRIVSMLVEAQPSKLEAKGLFRDIQEIQLKFLNVFDKFSKDNQITYWLDFGTLIGAARTNHFIPWDDDIDLTVPRKDYQKLLGLSNKLPEGFYISYGKFDSLLKLHHKSLPEDIGLDIFAADFVSNDLSIKQSQEITKRIYDAQKKIENMPLVSRKSILDKLAFDLGLKFEAEWKNSKMLCYGTEFSHSQHPSILISNDYIFPLSTIKFEGRYYPCPKKIDPYLTLLYRDYRSVDWSQPPHLIGKRFTIEEMLAISEFAKNEEAGQ